LAEASRRLAADNLTGADELVEQVLRQAPTSATALELRSKIAERRRESEEDVVQRRTATRALARARTQVAEGACEAAIRSLDEVFAVAPGNTDGLKLLEKAEAGIEERGRRSVDQQ